MITRDMKFPESEISKQETRLVNFAEDKDKYFIKIEFSRKDVPETDEHRGENETEQVETTEELWSECQEYPGDDQDDCLSRPAEVKQASEETSHDEQRLMKRAPGRSLILRTGSEGRPKKVY